jgi:uncharacterized protein YigA (DUF484 family)
MEKYGQSNDAMIDSLRNEEGQLMIQIQTLMSSSEKNASTNSELNRFTTRLAQVRGTITDFDLRKNKTR